MWEKREKIPESFNIKRCVEKINKMLYKMMLDKSKALCYNVKKQCEKEIKT